MMDTLKDMIDMGEFTEAVASMLTDILDPEEVAGRFWERYQDAIYDTIVTEIASELFDLPY